MKNAALFVGLALGGAGLYLWLKGQPKTSGVVGTTGTARTDPNLLTQFAGLFGRGQASTVSNQGGGGTGAYDSAVTASVGALANLAKSGIDAIIRAMEGGKKPEGVSGATPGNNPDGSYPATPYDMTAAYNYVLTQPEGGPPPLTGRNFGLEDAFDSAAADGWDYEWEFDS